ncbi:MAG: hypothetical protein K2M55_09035 [Muribaculaceae bacterium]|nr:hypothetical protein [Muribaculaceae bacterium]
MATTLDFTIALSIDRILESVYATSAAEHITADTEQPAILGTAHEAMLRSICRDVIAGLIFAIAPEVADTNIDDSSADDIIEIHLAQDPRYINIHLLRRSFEITAAAGVLSVVWKSNKPELSASWRKSYDESCTCLLDLIRRGPEKILPTS